MSEKLSLKDLTSLSGKTALVTGAAMGIGKAIAERLAEAGAGLVLIDVNESALAKTIDELQGKYKRKITGMTVDLGNEEAIRSMWQALKVIPDVVVNNAGIFQAREFTELDSKFINRTLDINLIAVVVMCQEFIRLRGKQGGTVVNISSIEAEHAVTSDMAMYGASKAGVSAIGRALTRDYTAAGFKINTVLPGGIMTPGGTNMAKEQLKHFNFGFLAEGIKFKSRLPAGHIGQPDNIARVVLFLASPMSDYLCGAEVVADGGFSAV